MSSYTVFARKYRPKVFADVLGQEHITRTLQNAIEQQRIAHAYIFVGPRGTGKTSMARVFAKALNCTGGPKVDFDPEEDICREIAEGRSLDVIEFDAASNTQVDKVRDLILDRVNYAPARGHYKIYLVDEVHMLSAGSFNALLKTLEEPPEHVKFFFATTDVQKVPTTILSRCQRFDLKRIPTATIAKHLLHIAKLEGFTLEPAAAEAVARGAEGGLRDAESMLDQLVAFCGDTIAEADVLSVFGFTGTQTVSHLCEAILNCDAPAALASVYDQAEAGKDLGRLMSDLISHLRNLLVLKADPGGLSGELMPEAIALLHKQADSVPMEKLLDLIEHFAGAEGRMKWAPNKKMHFEVAAIRAIQTLQSATLTEVIDTLAAMRGGQPPAAPASGRPVAKPAPAVKPAPQQPERKSPPADIPDAPAKSVEAKPAPVPAPPPAPAAVKPDEFWPALVDAVRRDRKLISAWVEAGALIGIEGSVANIGFPPDQAFAKDFIEQSHKEFMEGIASSLLGRPVTLRMQVREGLAVARPAPVAMVEEKRDPMEEFKNDPLIKKAIEVFRAEIQPA